MGTIDTISKKSLLISIVLMILGVTSSTLIVQYAMLRRATPEMQGKSLKEILRVYLFIHSGITLAFFVALLAIATFGPNAIMRVVSGILQIMKVSINPNIVLMQSSEMITLVLHSVGALAVAMLVFVYVFVKHIDLLVNYNKSLTEANKKDVGYTCTNDGVLEFSPNSDDENVGKHHKLLYDTYVYGIYAVMIVGIFMAWIARGLIRSA
jgi:hypothetical protein